MTELPEGIVRELPNEDYHQMDGISKSQLDYIAKSPAHFKHRESVPQVQTEAMFIGTAAHAAILEPELFFKEYGKMEKVDRRTKAGKARAEEIIAENEGKTMLDEKTYEMVEGMSNKINSIEMFRNIMDGAEVEVAAFYNWDGIVRKSKADIFRGDGILADVKTCVDASPREVERAIMKWRYYVQAPYYLDNFMHATGKKYDQFIFIFIEKHPPHGVAFYAANKRMMDVGRMEYKRNLDTYKQCLETDIWPDYEEKIIEVSLPPWFK